MTIRSIDMASQSLTRVGLGAVSPATANRPDAVKEEQQERSSPAVLRMAEGAEEAAERLSYDQPSGREGRAVNAYQSIARQEKRDELQQLLRLDIYA